LDGSLSSFLSQRLLLGPEKCQVPQLVTPQDHQFDTSNGELAKFAQQVTEFVNRFLRHLLGSNLPIHLVNLLKACLAFRNCRNDSLDRRFDFFKIAELLFKHGLHNFEVKHSRPLDEVDSVLGRHS